MEPLAAEHARRNRSRDNAWDVTAHHRSEVTRRIAGMLSPTARLCVLGAGNCHDLDLRTLGPACREIHLVDVDGEALVRGVYRQFGEQPEWLHLHGGCDVSGIFAAISQRSADDGFAAPADDLICQAADPGPLPLAAAFDVVVSAGLLSQLIDAVLSAVPEQSPLRWPLLLAVRTGHLRLCSRLTAPNGAWLLVTDFVSSASYPPLTGMGDAELAEIIPQLVANHNYFHGLNPLALPGLFGDDPVLRELVAEVRPRGYWLWRHRVRAYAVVCLECRRTALNHDSAS
jgi:hypothetical protein